MADIKDVNKQITAFFEEAKTEIKYATCETGCDEFIPGTGIFHDHQEIYSKYIGCITAISDIKEYNSNYISKNEIRQELDKFVLSKNENVDEFLETLDNVINKPSFYIAANFSIILEAPIKEFKIGDVKLFIKDNVENELELLPKDSQIIIDGILLRKDNNGIQMGGEISDILYKQCCLIKTKGCLSKIEIKARWIVGVAVSLFRLFYYNCKYIMPYIGELDVHSFDVHYKERNERRIIINGQNQASGGVSYCPLYYINEKINKKFEELNFQEIADKIFDFKPNTVAERIYKALGWMAEARAAEDISKRFLFFFTALEAIFTDGTRNLVTQKICKGTAVVIAGTDIETGNKICSEVKKLYEIRGYLIHEGNREVAESECGRVQIYTEMVCYRIIENCLDQSLKDFQADLKKASSDLKWPIKDETP